MPGESVAVLGMARATYEYGRYAESESLYSWLALDAPVLARRYSYLASAYAGDGRAWSASDRLGDAQWSRPGLSFKDPAPAATASLPPAEMPEREISKPAPVSKEKPAPTPIAAATAAAPAWDFPSERAPASAPAIAAPASPAEPETASAAITATAAARPAVAETPAPAARPAMVDAQPAFSTPALESVAPSTAPESVAPRTAPESVAAAPSPIPAMVAIQAPVSIPKLLEAPPENSELAAVKAAAAAEAESPLKPAIAPEPEPASPVPSLRPPTTAYGIEEPAPGAVKAAPAQPQAAQAQTAVGEPVTVSPPPARRPFVIKPSEVEPYALESATESASEDASESAPRPVEATRASVPPMAEKPITPSAPITRKPFVIQPAEADAYERDEAPLSAPSDVPEIAPAGAPESAPVGATDGASTGLAATPASPAPAAEPVAPKDASAASAEAAAAIPDLSAPGVLSLSGSWRTQADTALQEQGSALFAKLLIPLALSAGDAAYEFSARSLGSEWIGYGLHLHGRGPSPGNGYGGGDSVLVWLTSNPRRYGDGLARLEVYRSAGSVSLTLLSSVPLALDLSKEHAIRIEYRAQSGRIAVIVDGSLALDLTRPELAQPAGSAFMLLRSLDKAYFSGLSVSPLASVPETETRP